MITKTDAPATRSIQLEVEVPGTPEQVWQAIATGPGITAWFTPTEVTERKGGAISFHLGPGMDSTGVVTSWEPPRRFAYEERDWQPGAPPLATEFLIEARAGGLSMVRLVSSLFTSSADWDDQLESFEISWPPFLYVRRLYLEYFPGQRCSTILVTGEAPAPEARAWAALTAALGLSGLAMGERRTATVAGAPALAGIVERVSGRELVLRTTEPAPGVALIGAYTFGDQAPAVVARDEPAWRAWMAARFPSVEASSETGAMA